MPLLYLKIYFFLAYKRETSISVRKLILRKTRNVLCNTDLHTDIMEHLLRINGMSDLFNHQQRQSKNQIHRNYNRSTSYLIQILLIPWCREAITAVY
jgi:hypothetical protein